MNKFHESSEYLTDLLAETEERADELRHRIRQARVREFYFHMLNSLHYLTDEEMDDFHNSEFTLSFRGRSVTLYNGAELFQNIQSALEVYMDDEGIEYREEQE